MKVPLCQCLYEKQWIKKSESADDEQYWQKNKKLSTNNQTIFPILFYNVCVEIKITTATLHHLQHLEIPVP